MFVAFEWTQRDVKIDTSQAVADVVFEEEIIPITETPEQAAPPPPEAPKVAELLEIVDDKLILRKQQLLSMKIIKLV